MIDIKSNLTNSDGTNATIISVAYSLGKAESTLAAVESWFRREWQANKDYSSWIKELEALADILGIDTTEDIDTAEEEGEDDENT